MKRLIGYFLLATFVLLGSGLPGYLHNMQHQSEDAQLIASAEKSGFPKPAIPQHDESNCLIHRQLQSPMLLTHWVPVLVCLGWIVAFLSEIAPNPVSIERILRIDCRGPPVIA